LFGNLRFVPARIEGVMAKAVLCIDASVADREVLLAGLESDVEIVPIEATRDGIEQIKEDQFWLHSAGPADVDLVTDFDVGGDADTVVLQQVYFTLLSLGALDGGSFVSGAGASAADGDDYILYDTATGNLSYDADGDFGGSALLIATLTGAPTLTAGDFLIVA
jgi:hypothetical protein